MKEPNQDSLDEWLDTALRQYGNVQPRVGLEGRIARTLEVTQSRFAARRRWALRIATAVAVCVISISVWKGSSSPRQVGNTTQNFATQFPKDQTPRPERVKRGKPGITNAANHTNRHSVDRSIRAAASPRLSEFPAARPLSQEEQLLKAYVDQFPKQAVEIALEQAEREKELQALYQDSFTDSDHER